MPELPTRSPKQSRLELAFSRKWRSLYPDIPLESEVVFAKPRKFRFDFAHLETKIAIELQGGNFVRGRHTRGAALAKEYEKLNIAAENGWRMFFLDGNMVRKVGNYRAIANAIKGSS